jgi:hypothetical protein
MIENLHYDMDTITNHSSCVCAFSCFLCRVVTHWGHAASAGCGLALLLKDSFVCSWYIGGYIFSFEIVWVMVYIIPLTIECLHVILWSLCYLKNAVFWDVAPCRSCVPRRFGGTYRLRRSSETSVHTRCTRRHIQFFIVTAVKTSYYIMLSVIRGFH